MRYVKNREQLVSHGNVEARRTALDVIDHALATADPYEATKKLVALHGDILTIDGVRFDLRERARVLVLGAGKATYPIGKALEDLLGDRITDGVIICKYGQPGRLSRARLILAGHPIPDASGLEGARQALALAQQTRPGDLVVSCITGGSSALMPLPAEGVSLEDKQAVTRLLLSCGATIIEINAVRKHLSRIKGGFLAKYIHPQAQLINLTVSDVIGDPLDYITCPTVPDTSSFEDARATLTKYGLWDKIPPSIRDYLRSGNAERETPKARDLADHSIHTFVLLGAASACEGAEARARVLGLETMILSTMLEGESSEVGATFAAIAREIQVNGRPLHPPCVLIGGGETTVRITGEAGLGGPNQEFAVGAALGIDGIGDVAIVGVDSDGTDGPTEVAGGIVDDTTVSRARELGVNLVTCLNRHDVTPILRALGDAIDTGATGTNVNDLKVMVILGKS